MYHLVYVSTAQQEFSQPQILDLLVTCRERNEARGITGILLYGNRTFFQILEGEEETVHHLFQSILLDPRHRDVVVVFHEEIEEREFPNWSMSFKNLDIPGEIGIEGYSEEMKMPWKTELFASKARKFINLFKFVHDSEHSSLIE